MKHKNAVLKGLENMKEYDQCGTGIIYKINNQKYTVDEMITEIENETEVGIAFSQEVYNMVLTYLGKFSQHAS